MFIFNRRLKLRCQHSLVCCRNVATQGYTSYVHPGTRRLKFNLSFNKDFPISYQHKLTVFSWPSRTFPDPIIMSLILSSLPPTLTNTQVLTHRLFLTTNCFFFAAPYLGKHVLNWSPRLLFCHVFKTRATLFFKRLCILWNRKCLHDQMKKKPKVSGLLYNGPPWLFRNSCHEEYNLTAFLFHTSPSSTLLLKAENAVL